MSFDARERIDTIIECVLNANDYSISRDYRFTIQYKFENEVT